MEATNHTSILADYSIIGDNNIEQMISALMNAVEKHNVSARSFDELVLAVASDDTAVNDVVGLKVLAQHMEFDHVGHGLELLYTYVATGKDSNCPGHALSHYYVFQRNNETALATDNLARSKRGLPTWLLALSSLNQTMQQRLNVSGYDVLIEDSLARVNAGNSSATETIINSLSSAPCVLR